jgi:hypothetical protein
VNEEEIHRLVKEIHPPTSCNALVLNEFYLLMRSSLHFAVISIGEWTEEPDDDPAGPTGNPHGGYFAVCTESGFGSFLVLLINQKACKYTRDSCGKIFETNAVPHDD